MNRLEQFLTVQPNQTPMRQTPILTAEENCFLDKTRSMFFLMSLNCDQQSPVSYRVKSHTASPRRAPSGPPMHPLDLPSPAPPDPFLTQVSFTLSQLLFLEIEIFSVFQTSVPLSPLTDLTDTCQQTSKVTKLKRQHGHICLLLFSSQSSN